MSKFELRLKNIVCYEFTQRYCNTLGTTLEYLNKSNYENPRTQYNLNRNSFVVKAYTKDKFDFFKNTHKLGYDKVTKQLIKGNYAEFCKGKYDYVSHYTTPPLWTVIKTLDLGALLLMIQYLKPPTMEDVLARYNLSSTDAEMFISSIEIIKSLRNSTAHFNLVNRFRTEGSIQINVNLINRLNLSPMNQGYRIKLFDTLKVLGQYENIIGIKKLLLTIMIRRNVLKMNILLRFY